LSQHCSSDSLLILDLACIRKLNLEIIVNSKISQDIYYIDPSISDIYYCPVTLLMPFFKVSFLHENGAVFLGHYGRISNCLCLWTVRKHWTLQEHTIFEAGMINLQHLLSDLFFKCILVCYY